MKQEISEEEKNTIKYFLKQSVETILLPITKNKLFFTFMYILGVLVFMIETYVLNFKIPRFNFLSCIVDTYVLCLFLTILPKKLSNIFKLLFATILYSLALINIFCVEKFYARISPEILNVTLETTERESSEFIDKYISIDILFSGVGLVLLLLMIHVILGSIRHRNLLSLPLPFRNSIWMKGAKTLGAFIIIASFYLCFTSRINVIKLMGASNIEEIDKYISNFSQNTPLNNLLFSIKMRELANNSLSELTNTQDSVKVEGCDFTSDNIIMIIGESYIKCHSQLYGYKKETTPQQIKRTELSDAGCLIPFSDVVSPSNLTSTVFKYLFSLHSADQKSDWSNYPLFPVIFKQAGYTVGFLTNQFVTSLSIDIFNASGGLFLNDKKLSAAQFDYRNNQSHQFDIDLLTDYESLEGELTNHNLIIFHLAGQHIDFYKRSPQEFKPFKTSDYQERTDLNEDEKQLVADYDNATFYNDFVVDSIIKKFEDKNAVVIYVPDHGEECYDGLHRMGRLPGGMYKPEVLEHEYSIPFWIWCSRKYIENHPTIFEQIKSASSKPLMTDDISHVLLYLGGIKCDYYDETRNVLSDKYNIKRKRLIMGVCDYDKVINEKTK